MTLNFTFRQTHLAATTIRYQFPSLSYKEIISNVENATATSVPLVNYQRAAQIRLLCELVQNKSKQMLEQILKWTLF